MVTIKQRYDEGFEFAPIVKWIAGLLAALSVASIIGGVGAWRDVGVLRQDVVNLRDDMTGCRVHLDAVLEVARTNTVNRLRNEQMIERLERDVDALKTRPSTRADPLTGTEGRQLEERIKALEAKP